MTADKLTSVNGVVYVWADGACKGGTSGGRGGWGVTARSPEGTLLFEACGGDHSTTNNKMELQAAIESLLRVPEGSTLVIHTDSQYVVKGMNDWVKGWIRNHWRKADKSPVLNADLWQKLLALSATRTVTWRGVKGHAGDPGNERADELANMGVLLAV